MFYENLQTLCKDRGISVTKLLKELGMSSGNISKWSSKGYIPRSDTLKKFADYFDVPTDYFLSDHPESYSKSAELTEEEELLLDVFNTCSVEDRFRIIQLCMNIREKEATGEKVI